MFLIFAIYYGAIFYVVKKIAQVANAIEDKSNTDIDSSSDVDSTDDTSFDIDIEIDKENILYQSFMNEINKNNLDINKKILVCCTGDYQSMALLTIARNIFNKENISVLTVNHDNSNVMVDFMENICNFNNITFYYDNDNNLRNDLIKDICEKNNIDYVFEGHTLMNYSNFILNNIFENKKQELTNTIKPFLLIDNITLLKFFSTYNIPIDENLIHLNFSKEENKKLFDDMEQYISIIYPDWRLNIVKNYTNNNELINTNELENNCIKGKYGYLVKSSADFFNKISFTMFNQLINNLSEKYSFEKVNVDELDEYYMDNEDNIFFMSNTFLNKIDIFERYLLENNLEDFIEDILDMNYSENNSDNNSENNSENSFENLELNAENKSTQNENDENDDKDTSDTSNNRCSEDDEISINSDKEYILRVDLNNDTPDINIVEKLSENFRYEYLDGIIYVNISNNDFYVYDVSFNE